VAVIAGYLARFSVRVLCIGGHTMEEILVLGATQYNFTDDAGRPVAGVKVTYLTSYEEDSSDRLGFQVMRIGGKPELWRDLRDVPGVYMARFRQAQDAKTGKVTLGLVGLRFQRSFNITAAFEESALAAD
jgi:hypothetical protein